MLCKCPDCHRDVSCTDPKGTVTCPFCSRRFKVTGKKAKRVEEVIEVLRHGHYSPPSGRSDAGYWG